MAKLVKKAYMGVGGVAKLVYAAPGYGPLGRTSISASLSVTRSGFAVANCYNYAFFACGATNIAYDTLDIFNASFTRSVKQTGMGRSLVGGSSINVYAIFAGGLYYETAVGYTNVKWTTTRVDYIYCYSFTLHNTSLSLERNSLTGCNIGNYALFGGGSNLSSTQQFQITVSYHDEMTTYNTSMSRGLASSIGFTWYSCEFTASRNAANTYALYSGGDFVKNITGVVSYNTSLSKGSVSPLSVTRIGAAASRVGNYILFAGGKTSSNANSAVVDVYNSSLSRSTTTALSYAGVELGAAFTPSYAAFAGTSNGFVNTYDGSLVKSSSDNLSFTQTPIGLDFGNYIMFASTSVIDIYETE